MTPYSMISSLSFDFNIPVFLLWRSNQYSKTCSSARYTCKWIRRLETTPVWHQGRQRPHLRQDITVPYTRSQWSPANFYYAVKFAKQYFVLSSFMKLYPDRHWNISAWLSRSTKQKPEGTLSKWALLNSTRLFQFCYIIRSAIIIWWYCLHEVRRSQMQNLTAQLNKTAWREFGFDNQVSWLFPLSCCCFSHKFTYMYYWDQMSTAERDLHPTVLQNTCNSPWFLQKKKKIA